MSNNSLIRRQIMFDLDIKVLEQILGNKYRAVYANIASFLKEKGFDHPQGSGYISRESFSNTEVTDLIFELKDMYPYLEKCIRDIRVANIVDINSLSYIFDYDGTPGKYVDYENNKSNTKDDLSKTSLLKKLEKSNEQAKRNKQDKRDNIDHKTTKRDTQTK